MKDLERQAIPYELKNDGAIVLVPKDQVPRLRMKLAETGLPKGGGVGYEIFDKSDALGATSFVQNINHLRALEGELARTIRALRPGAGGARAPGAARAAAVLARQGRALRLDRAQGARRARAAAGAGDPPPRRFGGERAQARARVDRRRSRPPARRRRGRRQRPGGVSADERQAAFERRLREQIEGIVSSVVGPGRARVQLTADFDFNRVTQTSDKFDPEGRVLRSSQTREESSAHGDDSEGQVTVGNELPGAPSGRATTPPRSREQSRKSEEIVNYEISRTTKTEVTEGGRVNRISVAVLVDGIYAKNDKGETAYAAARQGGDRPHRRAGALGHRLRPEARRPGRGRQPALRRGAVQHRSPSRRASCRSCSSPRTTSCTASSCW